jgi:hypothetical protein
MSHGSVQILYFLNLDITSRFLGLNSKREGRERGEHQNGCCRDCSAHLAIISFQSHPSSLSPSPFGQHLPGDCIAETDAI